MKIKLYLAVIAFAAMAMFSGCAQDGAVGPQGPQGPAGTNANVLGSNAITAIWTQIGNTYEDSLIVPDITSDILSTGSVQVFIQYGTEWWALPDINGIGSGVVNTTLFGFGVGYLKLLNSNSDGSLPTSPYPPTNQFRAVIISSSAMIKHPYVNWKNYNQVKAALNLKD